MNIVPCKISIAQESLCNIIICMGQYMCNNPILLQCNMTFIQLRFYSHNEIGTFVVVIVW